MFGLASSAIHAHISEEGGVYYSQRTSLCLFVCSPLSRRDGALTPNFAARGPDGARGIEGIIASQNLVRSPRIKNLSPALLTPPNKQTINQSTLQVGILSLDWGSRGLSHGSRKQADKSSTRTSKRTAGSNQVGCVFVWLLVC
jgi:hypothetical protein